MEGGWGKLYLGGKPDKSEQGVALGDLQIGVDWRPVDRFGLVLNAVARAEPSDYEGDAAGIVEAYAEGLLFFREADRLRVRGGMFFLPTSRENVGPMWTSPYTITFSAVNSWIAEEVRPIGLDFDYRFEGTTRVTVGATGFVGNDAMGTLPGWRGWAMHDRMSAYDEVLPLPNLFSLRETFVRQKDGTTPITEDFDDHLGWSARLRIERPNQFGIQYTRLDNRGDRGLYWDEYSWATDYHQVGVDWKPSADSYIAAEYLDGFTAMGRMAFVDLDFHAAYLLGSYDGGRWRATLRRDWFRTRDLDAFPTTETNDEEGWAWTVALFWSFTPSLEAGFELVDLEADNVPAFQSGAGLDVGGSSALLRLRWVWGRTF